MSTSQQLGRRQNALAWFVSLLAGLLLVLSSLGQLSWRDGVTLLAIAVIGLIYIVKLMPTPN